MMNTTSWNPWPPLAYRDFAPTQHLLHMGLQAIGKLKLQEPFEPQWANVPLWITSRGLSTGPIPHHGSTYEVDVDFLAHTVNCTSSTSRTASFPLTAMPVADFVSRLFESLRKVGVEPTINMKPQEVPNTTPFDKDTEPRRYDSTLVQTWWRILVSTERIMQIFHARFQGKTQPIGLMWGTLDIRDVRYSGKPASAGDKADFIRRNAMNAELIEVGWWSGIEAYPKAAFYSFTYPQPKGIEQARLLPAAARWDTSMGEFLLDYDEVRKSADPDADILAFFESTYEAGAQLSGWDAKLVGSGRPE